MTLWQPTNKADPAVARLADDHYTRQTPGHRQFCRPGWNIVLYIPGPQWPFRAWAGWVWWRGLIRDDGYTGWWHCSLFRNESPYLSSDLIREAVEIAVATWGMPEFGFDTYVWPEKLRSTNPGYCYLQAGWQKGGVSKTGKLRLFLPPEQAALL